MANRDRLSDLSDDLLRRILHLAPTKEAASTTALSRRWRTPLWLSSGALNLEMRVDNYDYGSEEDEARFFFSRRDAFVSAAVAALDAVQHVTRLTLRLESQHERDEPVHAFLHGGVDRRWSSEDPSPITVLLSHPAARRVEELRLIANDWSSDNKYVFLDRVVGVYFLTLDNLPSQNLRVLELTNCRGLYMRTDTAKVVLPRLSSLRLRHCTMDLDSLQEVIDAAPALTEVRLEAVLIKVRNHTPSSHDNNHDWDGDGLPPQKQAAPTCRHLRCPAVTVLVLDGCRWDWEKKKKNHGDDNAVPVIAVEIDSPRLRRFRYMGFLRPFTFSPQPPELEQVDLHFTPENMRGKAKDPCRDLDTFWRLFKSFTSTKKMKLTLNHLEDVAVLNEARRVELLPAFPRLERLELEGVHRPKGNTAAAAIANLLRCGTALRDLRINLITEDQDTSKPDRYVSEFLEWKFRYDRDKSSDHFNRYRTDSFSSHGDEETIGVPYDEVSEIPCLSRRSFECLQTSLRTVGLQFQGENSNTLGIKLIKFFAENAMVLEEMHIDGGTGKLRDHVNHKIATWIAHSSKSRRLQAPSFVILPLKDMTL